MEIWKDIKEYEGLYQVSNLGNIKSLNYRGTKTEKLLKLVPNKIGYINVQLCKNGKPKPYYVHRLVATHFINNEENKKEVNHIDRNKANNNINNLEWCTKIENVYHSINYNKTSRYIGVSLCKSNNKWRSGIQIGKKKIHLGVYNTPYEAMLSRTLFELMNKYVVSNPIIFTE